jgi:hypothetical protein
MQTVVIFYFWPFYLYIALKSLLNAINFNLNERVYTMSKKKKKKKKQNRKNHNSNTPANVINPRSFFKKIGIKPQIKKGEERNSDHLIKGVLNRFGQGKVDEIERLAANNSNFSAFHYFHSSLELIKIWYGTDFNYLRGRGVYPNTCSLMFQVDLFFLKASS